MLGAGKRARTGAGVRGIRRNPSGFEKANMIHKPPSQRFWSRELGLVEARLETLFIGMRIRSEMADIPSYYDGFPVIPEYQEMKRLMRLQRTSHTKEVERQITGAHLHISRQSYKRPDQRNF